MDHVRKRQSVAVAGVSIVLAALLVFALIPLTLGTPRQALADEGTSAADTTTIECAVFDGVQYYPNATVVVKDGIIVSLTPKEGTSTSDYFLMPGLIDGHLHLKNADDATTQAAMASQISPQTVSSKCGQMEQHKTQRLSISRLAQAQVASLMQQERYQ